MATVKNKAENGSVTETKKSRKVKEQKFSKKAYEFFKDLNPIEEKILKTELKTLANGIERVEGVMFAEDFATLSQKMKKLLS